MKKNPTKIIERCDGVENKHHISISYYNKDGATHNRNGPAKVWINGTKEYYINGYRHREDGPARVWANGRKEWYLNGVYFPEEEWKFEVEKIKKDRLVQR